MKMAKVCAGTQVNVDGVVYAAGEVFEVPEEWPELSIWLAVGTIVEAETERFEKPKRKPRARAEAKPVKAAKR